MFQLDFSSDKNKHIVFILVVEIHDLIDAPFMTWLMHHLWLDVFMSTIPQQM